MSGWMLLLMLRRNRGSDDQFEQQLAEIRRAGEELAVALPSLPALAHAAVRDPALPDALLTIAPDRADSLAAALRPLIDPGRSSLLAFRRHAILPGKDSVRLFFG